jgi:hypothetical protein
MPFTAIVNFRGSFPYVTDGTGQTYCLADVYPTVRDGLTFGWSAGDLSAVDRSTGSSYAPEFSGMNYWANTSGGREFRLLLPTAGTYDVRLAIGDALFGQAGQWCSIRDGASGPLLATVVSGSSTTGGAFFDATGALLAPAAWRSGNTAVSVTTTGTVLAIRIGEATDGNVTCLAHLEVADTGSPALTAGPASFVHSGPAGIALSATAATGGTTPYTYQWQRNSGGGSYSDLANGGGVSGATTLALTDGSATAGTLYGYRLVVTDSSATPATATSNAVTAQVYPGGALSSGGFPLIGPGGLVG